MDEVGTSNCIENEAWTVLSTSGRLKFYLKKCQGLEALVPGGNLLPAGLYFCWVGYFVTGPKAEVPGAL